LSGLKRTNFHRTGLSCGRRGDGHLCGGFGVDHLVGGGFSGRAGLLGVFNDELSSSVFSPIGCP
jgi:hypothetical protein